MRYLKRTVAGLAALGFFFVLFFFRGPRDQGLTRREIVMGSLSEITVFGISADRGETLLEECFGILRGFESGLSIFDPGSEISGVNRAGQGNPQRVSAETYGLVRRAVRLCRETQGAFDVTVLGLMRLWGFYAENRRVPSHEEILKALDSTGCEALVLDPGSGTIGLKNPGSGIDLGGIAKGYACDRVVDYLKSQRVANALVNIGGTVYGLGNAPDHQPWKVGIRHPRDRRKVFKTVLLEHEAIATSGDYEQFLILDGRRYSHIMDPRTGYPSRPSVAVSVIAPSAELADALSTALFVAGPSEGPRMMDRFPDVRWYLSYQESDADPIRMISSDSRVPESIT